MQENERYEDSMNIKHANDAFGDKGGMNHPKIDLSYNSLKKVLSLKAKSSKDVSLDKDIKNA